MVIHAGPFLFRLSKRTYWTAINADTTMVVMQALERKPMEDKLIEHWERFKNHTGEPVSAAILTLAFSLGSDKGKRTGLTIKEAALFLGVGQTTVKELCRAGRLTPNRIGRAVRFNAEDLEAFQRRRTPLPPVNDASDLRHFQRKRK